MKPNPQFMAEVQVGAVVLFLSPKQLCSFGLAPVVGLLCEGNAGVALVEAIAIYIPIPVSRDGIVAAVQPLGMPCSRGPCCWCRVASLPCCCCRHRSPRMLL
jgi:hypothetical protein